MRVAIDISPLKSGHKFRGIGEYTKRLVCALENLKNKDLDIIIVEDPKKKIKDCDLIHYPYFDFFSLSLPFFKSKKTIVTIHDTIPLIFPRFYPSGVRGALRLKMQKLSLLTASAVITDSVSSEKDIEKYLNYPKEKIYVAPLSQGKEFKVLKDEKAFSRIRNKYSLPERFVLYVGDVNYNKNVLSLVKACKLNKITLVIAGRQARQKNFDKNHIENRPLARLLERYGKDKDVKRVGFVEDKDLVVLYNLAEVYCQPSYYEGFGLPVLEAMASGTPVVSSNKSSLPEAAGGAAILVDPENIEDIARGIRLAIEDHDLRQKLIDRGLKRSAEFSWEKTALKTYEVYKKVVQG
ncbi:MAG: glycosyltransferase family 1 protein [Patescibacteria group bacterium]